MTRAPLWIVAAFCLGACSDPNGESSVATGQCERGVGPNAPVRCEINVGGNSALSDRATMHFTPPNTLIDGELAMEPLGFSEFYSKRCESCEKYSRLVVDIQDGSNSATGRSFAFEGVDMSYDARRGMDNKVKIPFERENPGIFDALIRATDLKVAVTLSPVGGSVASHTENVYGLDGANKIYAKMARQRFQPGYYSFYRSKKDVEFTASSD